MKTRVTELMQIGDSLFSKRTPLLFLWQQLAEQFHPLRADFTRVRYISEEFASYSMTGRPFLAHRELTNAISAILRPRNQDWFKAETDNEQVNEDKQCKAWLQSAGRVMRKVMFDPSAQFTRATKEADGDYILTGNCVIEARRNRVLNGMMFRTWHLKDCVWAENSELVIDQFHRKWKLSARALLKLFPDTVHPDVKRLAVESPFTDINCRVIVLPTDEYDSYGQSPEGAALKRGSQPFVSITIDEEHQTILEEVPVPDLGYVIPRWVTIGGFSQYAYSPTAIVALPDARMLQQMTLTLIEVAQRMTDPPMVAVGDAIQGGVNLYAGAINWVDPDYDERTGEVLRPIPFDHSGVPFGENFEERIEKILQEAFFLNVLNLPPIEGEKMTAYEVAERMKEYIRRATPLFEPMDIEYNGQLCQATFNNLERMGAFGSIWDRPPALRGQRINFKFSNPLVQAEAERKTESFTRVSQLLGAAMQIDSSVRADFDVDGAFRDSFEGTGAPVGWLVDPDKANAIKDQVRQQQAAQQQAADLGGMGENASKMANAVENVGKAGSALNDAGLTQ